jgi:flagellar biosynthesis/type III secretory pathway protein FliH
MAVFQPDTSFARRRRDNGGTYRTTLAAVLAETADAAPARPAAEPSTPAAPPTPAAAPPAAEAAEPAADDTEPGTPQPDPATKLALADDELAGLLAGAAAEAHAAAMAATAARLADAETRLAEVFAQDAAACRRGQRETAELVAALVRTVASHVIPRAVAQAPLDDLLAELPDLLARLDTAERVSVAVHPDLAAGLDERLAPVAAAAGLTATLAVEADADLATGDARVRWPGGEATRQLDARLDEAVRLCAGWLAERDADEASTTRTMEASDEQ